MEQLLTGIPLTQGRGSFLGGHDEAIRYLVAALVEAGANNEAVRAARWVRSLELVHAAQAGIVWRACRTRDGAGGTRRWVATRESAPRSNETPRTTWAVPQSELAAVRAARRPAWSRHVWPWTTPTASCPSVAEPIPSSRARSPVR